MSEFEGDYWHPLDKDLAVKYQLNPGTIGISAPPMKGQLDELKTKIFQGATHVELGFMGREKGSMAQGGTTPEMYGKEERAGMRELAKVNDVTLSTHATTGVTGMSGMTEQGFSEEAQERALHEIERAVDFAADIGGGPVVVHAGEFPRAVSQFEGFEGFPGEKDKSMVYSANQETGQILPLRKDTKVMVVKRTEDGTPIVDPKTGGYEFEPKTYKDYEKEQDNIKQQMIQEGRITQEQAKKMGPAQLFYLDHMGRELDLQEAEEKRWVSMSQKAREEVEVLNDFKKAFDKQAQENLDVARHNLYLHLREIRAVPRVGTPEFYECLEKPEKYFDKVFEETRREIQFQEQGALSYGKNAARLKEDMGNLRSIEDVGLDKAADALSRAAMTAYEREKAKGLKQPVWIAPENLFPETGFGSHPSELRDLILRSRKAMEDKLVRQRGFERDEAKKLAKDHIKATFDIGHANTWKKFFVAKEGETPEQVDKRFNKWLLSEVDKLAKDGIIGHVHLSDNFGYYDEHVTPGEASAPIKEFVEKMKKAGYSGMMVVEPAHQDYRAMTGAWRALNSPIYRIDGSSQSWTDIQSSYFGRTGSPSYIVGEYAPDPKEWTFWSETQLE